MDRLIGITNYDFTGKRVLDVATNEGWWALAGDARCRICRSDVELVRMIGEQ